MVGNPNGIGGWKPGESGNPGGTPKGAREVRNRALEFSHEALDVLCMLMRAETHKDTRTARLRMDAASAILDRGIGKPGQSLALQLDISKKLSELTDDEMVELARRWPELEASDPLQIEHDQRTRNDTD